MSTFESKVKASYEHGKLDFYAGIPCDPDIPLKIYSDLDEEQKKIIQNSWKEGWLLECSLQSLPERYPA